ncbi:MAG: prepilin-type N-terminal cleavage/methylation domain-containing protein [Parvularculaceae bacterium]
MDRQAIARARQRGVTLVELLVVMAILVFAASLIVLNAPPVRAQAKEEAERFAARTRAAWEDSVVQGTAAAVAVSNNAYKVERFVGGKWQVEPSGRPFSERRMPPGVAILAKIDDPALKNEASAAGKDDKKPARIILDPIGLTTPFRVEFRDGRERWVVRNLPDETIMVERDGDR